MAGFFPVFYSSLSADIDTSEAQFWFNVTLAVSSLLIAFAAPVLGAVADRGGERKTFLIAFTLLGIIMSAALAWVAIGMWWLGLMLYGLGSIGFSGANIFYDSMIVDVSKEEDFDIVSGYGYALGYVGGGLLLGINVLMVTHPDWFGLSSASQALSLSFISVGIWWGLFSLPLILAVKIPTYRHRSVADDNAGAQQTSVWVAGFAQLRETFREVRRYRTIMWFLAGYWLYIDGVGTVIKMAVFFANRIVNIPAEGLVGALLLTQFVSFPSALFFGWLGKRIGPKFGIMIGLVVYILCILYAWGWLETKSDFYVLAISIGLVQGGVQSLSRSLFARLIPRGKSAEFFGFFNMVGKFASILGPMLMAAVPLLFAGVDERESILVLILLFVAGGLLLSKVNLKAN